MKAELKTLQKAKEELTKRGVVTPLNGKIYKLEIFVKDWNEIFKTEEYNKSKKA